MEKSNTVEDNEHIVQRVKASLESTINGLIFFAESLEKAGFKSSVSSYKQLRNILIQQRLWTSRQTKTELQPLWDSLSLQANTIYEMLVSFAEIMNDLRNINEIKDRFILSDNIQNQQLHQQRILETLNQPQFVSAIKLSKLLNIERKKLIDEIDQLVNKRIVKKTGVGNGISYRAMSLADR